MQNVIFFLSLKCSYKRKYSMLAIYVQWLSEDSEIIVLIYNLTGLYDNSTKTFYQTRTDMIMKEAYLKHETIRVIKNIMESVNCAVFEKRIKHIQNSNIT